MAYGPEFAKGAVMGELIEPTVKLLIAESDARRPRWTDHAHK